MTRKIIMVTANGRDIHAVCDDGTLWWLRDGDWERAPDIPQDDEIDEPEPPLSRRPWRPNGWPIWCVDLSDRSAVEVPNADVFVRWCRHREKGGWVLVEAEGAEAAIGIAEALPGGPRTFVYAAGEQFEILCDIPF